MSGSNDEAWVEQATAEGAALSADPGESGDVPAVTPGQADPLGAPPSPDERTFPSPDSDPGPTDSPAADDVAPGNHMGPGGDPVEG
jgi:hypothetical protein